MKKPFTAFLITLAVFTAGTAKGTALPVDSIHADFREFIRYLEETHPDPYTPYGDVLIFMPRHATSPKAYGLTL